MAGRMGFEPIYLHADNVARTPSSLTSRHHDSYSTPAFTSRIGPHGWIRTTKQQGLSLLGMPSSRHTRMVAPEGVEPSKPGF